ncbi:MAG: hypothetical protein IKP68_07600 [Clostridia bacterium]|nr:hypothetical protein [Clostridia bacterium]
MRLEKVATIRIGAVSVRKKSKEGTIPSHYYKALNLKCLTEEGNIDINFADEYPTEKELKPELLTQKGDVLIRLSFPYTSVLIDEKACGLFVPSHFAILRANPKMILPEYILWFLRRECIYQQILQNSSGSTAFGTISSGFIGSLNIRILPIKKQKALGQLLLLSSREQELLNLLAKEKAILHKETLNIIYDKFKGEN